MLKSNIETMEERHGSRDIRVSTSSDKNDATGNASYAASQIVEL